MNKFPTESNKSSRTEYDTILYNLKRKLFNLIVKFIVAGRPVHTVENISRSTCLPNGVPERSQYIKLSINEKRENNNVGYLSADSFASLINQYELCQVRGAPGTVNGNSPIPLRARRIHDDFVRLVEETRYQCEISSYFQGYLNAVSSI